MNNSKNVYTYNIYISLKSSYWYENVKGICANYFTHNEQAIITKTTVFIGNKNCDGVSIKVIDHRPENTKAKNQANAETLASILLKSLYQEKALIEIPNKILEIYNDNRTLSIK